MTPAIERAEASGISFSIHTYRHERKNRHYGAEAVEKLAVSPDRVFKTLVVETHGGELALCVLPVSRQLDLKQVSDLLRTKKVQMADPRVAEKATGYVSGGISPIVPKKNFSTLIDRSALDRETIFVSGGRRGVEIELKPDDLCMLTQGRFEGIVLKNKAENALL
ncbi:Cys-tRNA(Pro) deacylase [Desulfosarcina sp. OttesenSCG-928-A07]|nr:Cys-tRNA(Pro) deacylase [Desulfosarcina sp. OttesenSCG-928-G17]MDL2329604.1 Cys-tRNA(Pro) deacylase [Desulfosarcina sp. OttesenSCG-928-A07]